MKAAIVVGGIALVLFIFWRVKGKEFCTKADRLGTVTTNIVTPSFKLFSHTDDQHNISDLEVIGLVNDLRFERLRHNPFCEFKWDSANNYSCIVNGTTFYMGKVIPLGSDLNFRYVSSLKPDSQDSIILTESHSAFFWIPPGLNLFRRETRHRFAYITLKWQKPSGQTLVIKWKYLHHYKPNLGWSQSFYEPNLIDYGVVALAITNRTRNNFQKS